MANISSDDFKRALLALTDETFAHVHGYYLDRGTSLFETLAGISASEASVPVGGKCATLAAQVKHVAFYLEVYERSLRDPDFSGTDWGEIWRTVSSATTQEWQAIQDELRTNYERILQLIDETTTWSSEDEIGEAIAVVVHTAYHLGEIRQALCTLKS